MAQQDKLASQLHENWRTAWHRENGAIPRMKTTKDRQWIRSHNTNQVDIAATAFRDLPRDWQEENLTSAKAAIGIVERLKREGKSFSDPAVVEEASALLHENWLTRNRSWASAVQKRPYNQLPEEEKEKDRVVIRLAI